MGNSILFYLFGIQSERGVQVDCLWKTPNFPPMEEYNNGKEIIGKRMNQQLTV